MRINKEEVDQWENVGRKQREKVEFMWDDYHRQQLEELEAEEDDEDWDDDWDEDDEEGVEFIYKH